MIGKDELTNFKKMWTWLIGYPAHDRDYYMTHVAKLDEQWSNRCPLSNSSNVKDCSGCKMLWGSQNGTLCSDPSSPLVKWQTAKKELPDDRSYFASQLAVLAMHCIHELEDRGNRDGLRRVRVH